MIESMQTAMKKISKLPDIEQKKLASLIEQELKWQESETDLNTELSGLADEAINEHKAGKTEDLDW